MGDWYESHDEITAYARHLVEDELWSHGGGIRPPFGCVVVTIEAADQFTRPAGGK